MKMKSALLSVSMLLAGVSASNAASFVVSNVGDLVGNDTLYATQANTLMNGSGLILIGYFNSASIVPTTIDGATGLFANLGNFITQSTAVPGAPMSALGDLAVAGYADAGNATDIGVVAFGNPLIGRTVYAISTSASSLAAALLTSEYSLVARGTIIDEGGGALQYTSNPTTPAIIGSKGTFTGDLGFGQGTYATMKMATAAAIPEPSAVLLGAIGALGLLRRRRN